MTASPSTVALKRALAAEVTNVEIREAALASIELEEIKRPADPTTTT